VLRVLLPVSIFTTAAIILSVAYASPPSSRPGLYWVLAACIGVELGLLIVLRQVVKLEGGRLVAAFVPFFPWTRRIPLGDLAAARVVKVSPMTELGGYGLKWSKKHGLAFIVNGDGAVAIVERTGRKTLLGSPDPEGLLDAIRAHHHEHVPGHALPETPDDSA